MKTLEQLAIEWEQQEPECGLKRNGFLAGYKAAQQWISVKERLPEPLESVLIVYAPTNEAKNDYRIECWNWPETYVYETKFITHWMPLPEAPKEG